MKLTSSEYKEIARDALKGNWGRAVGAMLLAACLGVFCSSLYFISHFMFVMSVSIRIFESLPHYFLFLVGIGIVLAVFFFSQAERPGSAILILIWPFWTEEKPGRAWWWEDSPSYGRAST